MRCRARKLAAWDPLPQCRVVRTDIAASDAASGPAWRDVIPQHPRDLLQWACLHKGGVLSVCYLHDVQVRPAGCIALLALTALVVAPAAVGMLSQALTQSCPLRCPVLNCSGCALFSSTPPPLQAKLQLRNFADGSLRKDLPLPGVGSIGGFSGNYKHSEMLFTFVGFTEPGATYK